MKQKYTNILVIFILFAVIIGFAAFVVYNKRNSSMYTSGKYTYLQGSVSAYDVSPAFVDGNIIFKIDNESVDIGGGLRPQTSIGHVYEPIQIGDKVSAKLIRSEGGGLTVYDCSECYVKRSE